MTTPGSDIDRPEIVEERPIEALIDDAFIARFEKVAQLYQERYLPLCIRMTNEADWINHGRDGQPRYFLQSSGAEKVCTPLGITWERPVVTKHEREDEKGKFYEYEVEGILHSRVLGRYGWFTGNCNSRDQFFLARPGWNPSNGEGDIRKAALSNWIVNGVTRLAGIRNPTAALLEKAGLKPDAIARIDYSGQGSRKAEESGQAISEAQAKRFWAIARGKGWTEIQVKVLLESFEITKTDAIPRSKYEALCKIVGEPVPPEIVKEAELRASTAGKPAGNGAPATGGK